MIVERGDTILAAHFEHTNILIGFNETLATVLDGSAKNSGSIQEFLDLWNKLDSLAIIGRIQPSRPGCAGRAAERMPSIKS
jgi:hypothetical protein